MGASTAFGDARRMRDLSYREKVSLEDDIISLRGVACRGKHVAPGKPLHRYWGAGIAKVQI